ncbi:KTSC domain-containing protein [Anaerobutyricum soehngenii]|uniref:KTSC domain-containing protein n=1 Tax=Anaerobutyricum soehngenii TaxID=105843 RepID=UPI001C101F61|nr:KTSC domain-containing protein [Anaerobutyricum soehngenii]MBU5416833.1 KTSC domain-containing protein [Anaerobutyricum soehngenii]
MDINFNIGFGKIDSLSWDSSLLKIQFSNGEVIVYENITFTEYQQLLSDLTAADKPSIEAMLNELEMYHVHHVA